MIIVFFTPEVDEYNCRTGELTCSHGIDTETDELIAMPQLPIGYMRDLITFNSDIGEYILK